jgi:two-component system sensor histidine kinase KdpD
MTALRYSDRMDKAWLGYAWAMVATAASTLIGLGMVPRFDVVNVAMVYVSAVLLVALRLPRGPTILTSVLSVLAFDVVFVPPQGVLTIDDVQYLFTFAIMAAIGLVVSGLRAHIRRQEQTRAELASATETERIRSTLLASISHDLRTPLAVLAGASSTLAEQGERMGADERVALARSLYRQAGDLSERVSKLLQMTRLQQGAIRAERDWVSFAEIAATVVRLRQDGMPGHHVLIEVPVDLPLVHVDALLIEQALGNLVDNAVRHTPDGTVVRIRASQLGDTLTVSVEDDGHRFRDEALERAFLSFNTGASAAGSPGLGLGLGLSICRAIVRLHGGKSWGEYLPGGGVAFRFSLPLEPPPMLPPEPEPA